jgi:hypothetical protein
MIEMITVPESGVLALHGLIVKYYSYFILLHVYP